MASSKDKWNATWKEYNANKKHNYDKALNQYGQSVADLMENWYNEYNPASKYYFRNDNKDKEYENFVNDMTKKRQDELTQYMDRNFTGFGGSNMWMDDYWNSASDDDYVNSFIDTQYNDAMEQLERALKRGTLSQSGYENALNNLNLQKSGAYNTIGSIGQGILDNYRNDLNTKVQGFASDIDNFNLNMYDQMNTDEFKSGIDNLYNDQLNSFENEFNLQTQDLKPFDISSIIGDARVAQGVNNTQTDQLLGAIEDTEKKKKNKVGLGNQGLF